MVKLLFITPDYAKTIEYAARTSTATECKENSEDFVRKLVKKKHLSVGRHCNASFEVIGSRAMSHQLVRHTHLNYTQESQRYVKFGKTSKNFENKCKIELLEENYIVPDSIKNCEILQDGYYSAVDEFKCAIGVIEFSYQSLIKKFNVPKEDARYLLPNACKTRLVVSGNFQAWWDFIKLRTDKSAQWEIREIAEQIRDILIEEAPAFFDGLKGE
jgi:thymidylate synthase (FAD)